MGKLDLNSVGQGKTHETAEEAVDAAFGKYDEPVKSTPVDTTPAALPKGTDPSPFTLGHSK